MASTILCIYKDNYVETSLRGFTCRYLLNYPVEVLPARRNTMLGSQLIDMDSHVTSEGLSCTTNLNLGGTVLVPAYIGTLLCI